MDPILLAIVVVAVLVLIYYGMGRNIEVGARMVTRELEDAERMQKERIVRKNAEKKDGISDEKFTAAVDHMAKIDALDI